jgi:hypothetical protein
MRIAPKQILDPNSHPLNQAGPPPAFRGEYSGSNLIYAGFAEAGTLDSDDTWSICLLTYSGSNLTSITHPNGNKNFNFVWDDRAGYSYS